MKNPKNKGNTFERKIANLLSDRFKGFTGLEKSFRRNADSGSFFGGGNSKRISTHDTSLATLGDIVCPPNFKFVIECKNYKSAPMLNTILRGESKQWDTWISQVTQDSENSGKEPLLIVKYNGVEDFVFVNKTYEHLRLVFTYKNFFAYTLHNFLTQNDEYFFDKD